MPSERRTLLIRSATSGTTMAIEGDGWQDTVSERLRRWTRNPLGSARRGSNPLGVVFPKRASPNQVLKVLSNVLRTAVSSGADAHFQAERGQLVLAAIGNAIGTLTSIKILTRTFNQKGRERGVEG